MKPEHKALHKKIDKFLATQNPSDGGGWAEVKDGETDNLGKIFDQIVRYKYEEDADGDLPISWALVNSTQGRFIIPPWLNFMPYEYKDLKGAISNLLRATEFIIRQLHKVFDLQRLEDRIESDKKSKT